MFVTFSPFFSLSFTPKGTPPNEGREEQQHRTQRGGEVNREGCNPPSCGLLLRLKPFWLKPFPVQTTHCSHVCRGFCLEETDFGQSRFGHPDLTYLGPSNFGFGPIHFWIVSWPQRVGPKPRKNRAPKGGAPNFGGVFEGRPLYVRVWSSRAVV